MEYIEIDTAMIETETPKAYLVNFKSRQVWLPKSQVSIVEIPSGPFAGCKNLQIPVWLASKNRMRY